MQSSAASNPQISTLHALGFILAIAAFNGALMLGLALLYTQMML